MNTIYPFCLPDLGEGLPDAVIEKWHVAEGQWVEAASPLVSVETAKALVDLPAPCAGQVLSLHGVAGDRIATGHVLVEIETQDTALRNAQGVVGELPRSNSMWQDAKAPNFQSHLPDGAKMSPEARAWSAHHSVDGTTCRGSGPHGTVLLKDVMAQKTDGEGHIIPVTGLRRRMADAVMAAYRKVPMATLQDEVVWREKPQDFTASVIQAICHAFKAEPECNAWYTHDAWGEPRLQVHKDVHLGLAVDTPSGLVVPVLKCTQMLASDAKSLRDAIDALRAMAHHRTLDPASVQGATCTLSNFGMWSGRWGTPFVSPPQVMIVGVGRCHMGAQGAYHMPVSIGFDHRALTGGQVARYLEAMRRWAGS